MRAPLAGDPPSHCALTPPETATAVSAAATYAQPIECPDITPHESAIDFGGCSTIPQDALRVPTEVAFRVSFRQAKFYRLVGQVCLEQAHHWRRECSVREVRIVALVEENRRLRRAGAR